ncbi:RNA-binding protein with multiple splicing 2 [Schistosoma japonicum]|nr:RNA-binding protein with multiple splicing 2 [Schistosoma japonicum]
MCLLESIQMMTNTTTTTMPPPKAPQCSLPPNSSHNSNAYHSENSLQDDDQPIVLDGSCLGANLNEDSMMILSQSIDSIHTVGTNNGEGTEVAIAIEIRMEKVTLFSANNLMHQVRTLFVSGLPLDAKPRELYLLFRSFKGVKFDPDGNQHMRLEFARSNTKVTKPKITIPVGFSNVSSNNPHHNGLNQYNSLTNLGSCTTNMMSTGNLTGMVANLQPSIFAQLAGTGSTTYLSSAAGLVQANNFRTLVPGNMNTGPYGMHTGSSSPIPSLQMVQAAIAHANAAAALCSANASSMGATVCSPSTLTLSPQINTQVSFCNTGTSNTSSPNSGAGSSPATASALSQNVNPNLRNNYFPNHQPNQSNVASFMAQLQQQQHQTLAAVQLNQHTNPPNTLNSTLGFANAVSAAAGLPPQMAAAAIGLLGGYNSIIKELAGSEGQLQPGLSPFQQNVNF